MEAGKEWVAEIDLTNYFDTIPHGRMKTLINETIRDLPLRKLLFKYLQARVIVDGHIQKKGTGLIQGCAISPLLSNLYLNAFDQHMEQKGFFYIRYADNIYVYTENEDSALAIYQQIEEILTTEYQLSVNSKKSGVYLAVNRRFLGYYFECRNKKVLVKKSDKKNYDRYHYWHPTAVECIDQNYHIIHNGILNKQDYTMLFENENGQRYLPAEAVESISIYSDVIFTSGFFEFMNKQNLRISMYDRYGSCIDNFIPARTRNDISLLMKQAAVYTDQTARLALAKKIHLASMHNIRMNISYYQNRKKSVLLSEVNDYIKESMKSSVDAQNIDSLLMTEARVRQKYYKCFNEIINDPDFRFEKRTRRPPKDPINALISFGNTFLYNRIATEIYKTPLNIRFGLVHAANSRSETLNLDLADLFKPILVDKVIFTLINRKMPDVEQDFSPAAEQGVYLTTTGKKKFIQELQDKLYQKVTVKNKSKTYIHIIRDEIWKLVNFYRNGEEYKAYKHQI